MSMPNFSREPSAFAWNRTAIVLAASGLALGLSGCGGSTDETAATDTQSGVNAESASTERAEALRSRACRLWWLCRPSTPPAPTPPASPASAPTSTAVWTKVADEWGSFTVTVTRRVRYGANSTWVERDVSGQVACTNDFFGGDPLYGQGIFKQCQLQSQTGAPAPAPVPAPAPGAVSDTLRVSGRTVLDTCGQPLVVRGVENFIGLGIDINGSWDTLIAEIAKSGANSVRLLPNLAQLGTNDVENLLKSSTSRGLVVFLSPGDSNWFYNPGIKPMLDKYKKWLILDIFQEPTYDDRARWQSEASASIRRFRNAGYTTPVTILANQYGRDLPSLLINGPAVIAADTQRSTILGWQAYWGNRTAQITGGWSYQGQYGMSISEGITRAAAQPFPIQAGIVHYADGDDPTDYSAVMAAAQQRGVGWLAWDWYNPFGRRDNLANDGTAARLTDVGNEMVKTDANSIERTSRKACGR